MSSMFLNAGVLFGRAVAAYERAKAGSSSDRELGQMDALEAIIFSVVSLEAFINEAAELATHMPLPGSESIPPSVTSFAQLMKEVEQSRGSLCLKFMLARFTFAGESYEAGTLPFQDFVLLVELRNALTHYRSLESFGIDKNGAIIFTPAKILERLRSKNILAEQEPSDMASWLLVVATVAVARWSCRTAAAMVESIVNVLPQSRLKEQMNFLCSRSFQGPK